MKARAEKKGDEILKIIEKEFDCMVAFSICKIQDIPGLRMPSKKKPILTMKTDVTFPASVSRAEAFERYNKIPKIVPDVIRCGFEEIFEENPHIKLTFEVPL